MVLNAKVCKNHDFKLLIFRLVRFGISFFSTTRQTLSQKFYDASDFESIFLQRVRY